MRTASLHKVLTGLMVLMAAALVITHTTPLGTLDLPLWAEAPSGVAVGFGIGVVAAIMGVAAGSVAGAVLGGLFLGALPDAVLIPAPALILLVSAVKPARHE
ncbi:hypothetical protein ACFQ7A_04635 [Streptomyces sp. NPDC056528]|uniref:hypothetical protein n=1 Tax=Streptomyces sp. NPDC056528 TaxID=3345854 RepID=UPI0036C62246